MRRSQRYQMSNRRCVLVLSCKVAGLNDELRSPHLMIRNRDPVITWNSALVVLHRELYYCCPATGENN